MEDTLVGDYQFAHSMILLASNALRPEVKDHTSPSVRAPLRGFYNKVNLNFRGYLRPIWPQNNSLSFKYFTPFIWGRLQFSNSLEIVSWILMGASQNKPTLGKQAFLRLYVENF